jgi:hypothetical protein
MLVAIRSEPWGRRLAGYGMHIVLRGLPIAAFVTLLHSAANVFVRGGVSGYSLALAVAVLAVVGVFDLVRVKLGREDGDSDRDDPREYKSLALFFDDTLSTRKKWARLRQDPLVFRRLVLASIVFSILSIVFPLSLS